MPHKHNVARRHRIGEMKFKVTNWLEFEAGSSRSRQSDAVADAESACRMGWTTTQNRRWPAALFGSTSTSILLSQFN
jgi:hypothetical protein